MSCLEHIDRAIIELRKACRLARSNYTKQILSEYAERLEKVREIIQFLEV